MDIVDETNPVVIEDRKRHEVPRCILEHKQRLKSFCVQTTRELKASLESAPKSYIDCLREIVYNVIFGFLPVSQKILNQASKTQEIQDELHYLVGVLRAPANKKWRRLDKRNVIYRRRELLKAIVKEVLAGVKSCK